MSGSGPGHSLHMAHCFGEPGCVVAEETTETPKQVIVTQSSSALAIDTT